MESDDHMYDLSNFAVTRRWPPRHPERIQYYGVPSPNGVKVSIMLEETGLAYEAHRVDIGAGDQATPEFLSLNPYGKIPAIIDPCRPDGPLGLWDSGAILIYLAEKTGRFLSSHPQERHHTLQWLLWQASAVGPIFGQVGFFHKFAGREIADRRPLDHYAKESRRLLEVLEGRLADRRWIMGDAYSIADIATLGWIRNLIRFYDAAGLVDYHSLKRVPAWLDAGLSRPAVARGLQVCAE